MNRAVSQLVEVIRQEIICLEKFLTLLTEEQECLVDNEVDSLRRCIQDQEKTIGEAQKLEEARIKLTDSLAEKLKIDKGEVNMSKLIELMEESYSTKLRELQSILFTLYAKLERQRKKNEFLIRQSMKYVDKSMKIFLGLREGDRGDPISWEKDRDIHSGNVVKPKGLRLFTAKDRILV